MRVLVKSFTSMLMSLFMCTGCKMLHFCAREGPHAHVRVERCTSTNTLYKSASWTPPLRIWKGAGGALWTTSALRLSFFVALQLWSAFLPASVAAQKGEGLPIFEQVGPNFVNPH